MKRQPNGRFRGVKQAVVLTDGVLRAGWVGAETLRLKTMGFSFEEIAEQIVRVAKGVHPALVPIPEDVSFPPGYSITKQAVYKAFQKAIARQPALALEELREVDNARSEEMFLSLQPGIRKGNANAIATGIKVLDHSAKINGYAAPRRYEMTGKDGKPLTLVQLLNAVGEIADEE
jgi:hypothetical protein